MSNESRPENAPVNTETLHPVNESRPKNAADSVIDPSDHADDLFDDTLPRPDTGRRHSISGSTVVECTAKSTQTDAHLPSPHVPVDHRDVLAGQLSIHPVGTSVGAATGAAAGAAAGAAIGATLGPIGAALGAAAGAIAAGFAGGAAGRRVAESVNPSTEDHYWHAAYARRPYIRPGTPYEAYRPAFLFGAKMRLDHCEKTWTEAEPHLEQAWNQTPDSQKLPWNLACPAIHDAWDKLTPCDPDL